MNELILIPQSLHGEAYDYLIEYIGTPNYNKMNFSCVKIFSGMKYMVDILNVRENFENLLNKFSICNIKYEYFEDIYDLNEYFYFHSTGKVYVTSTSSQSHVVASAAIMGFKGDLYLFDPTPISKSFKKYSANINLFNNNRANIFGLEDKRIMFDHIFGTNCYFNLNGKDYCQIIPEPFVCVGGSEGYTFECTELSDYRIKIFTEFKPKYDFDKVDLMIKFPYKNDQISFPITWVFNDKGEKIGYIMKSFKGKIIGDFGPLERLGSNSLKAIKGILSKLIWLEGYGFLHRDFDHNILIGDNGESYIIDIDSVQFDEIPATAKNKDPEDALPKRYQSDALLFNTVELSHVAFRMTVESYMSFSKLIGVLDTTAGHCLLKETGLNTLAEKNQSLELIAENVFYYDFPASIERILLCLMDVIKEERVNQIKIKERYDSTNSDKKSSVKDPELIKRSEVSQLKNETKDEKANKVIENDTTKKENVKQKKIKIDNKSGLIDKVIKLIKAFILLFFDSGNTLSKESFDKNWNRFVRSGKWKKTLLIFILAVFCTIILLLTITYLF